MTAYGLTNEDFGRYTVVARDWAATNPAAWFHGRSITLADHQASRWIVEPIIRLLDCCQESDGGVALVVTTAERAADLDCHPVEILAAAQGHARAGDELFDYYRPDLTVHADTATVAAELHRQCGWRPEETDVAMIYENFSPVVFLQLEALGFCPPGEARDLIAGGHIGRGGEIPVNPNGGLLGEAYIHGMNNITEAVRQLRGTAANQIDGARRVVVSAGRSGLVLGTKE